MTADMNQSLVKFWQAYNELRKRLAPEFRPLVDDCTKHLDDFRSAQHALVEQRLRLEISALKNKLKEARRA